MFSRKISFIALAAALSAAPVTSMAVIIDSFNGVAIDGTPGQRVTVAPADGSIDTQTQDAIGQWRTINYLAYAPDDTGSKTRTNSLAVPGSLSVSNDDGYTSTVKLTWDNANAAPNYLGGLDLTSGGLADGLKLTVGAIDVGNVKLTFTVTDSDGDVATKVISDANVGVQYFPFTGFTNEAATNFASVNIVTLTVEALAAGADLNLDLIETSDRPTVPEPASLSLFGIGLLGFLASRRKNRG